MTLKRTRQNRKWNCWRTTCRKPVRHRFTRQQQPLGLGHAVWCARDIIGNEPFAVLLPDVLVKHKPSSLKQMIDAANAAGADKANIIAVEEVPMESVHMYGVVGVGKAEGRPVRTGRDGGKTEARACPIEPLDHRALHPAAGNLRDSPKPRKRGAGGEDPAHRRDARPSPSRRPSTASSSRARATTAAPSPASSPPTSPMRWTATICVESLREEMRQYM